MFPSLQWKAQEQFCAGFSPVPGYVEAEFPCVLLGEILGGIFNPMSLPTHQRANPVSTESAGRGPVLNLYSLTCRGTVQCKGNCCCVEVLGDLLSYPRTSNGFIRSPGLGGKPECFGKERENVCKHTSMFQGQKTLGWHSLVAAALIVLSRISHSSIHKGIMFATKVNFISTYQEKTEQQSLIDNLKMHVKCSIRNFRNAEGHNSFLETGGGLWQHTQHFLGSDGLRTKPCTAPSQSSASPVCVQQLCNVADFLQVLFLGQSSWKILWKILWKGVTVLWHCRNSLISAHQ